MEVEYIEAIAELEYAKLVLAEMEEEIQVMLSDINRLIESL